MCGIAGYFGARVLPPASVERMLAALRQRGPDAEHTRLLDAGSATHREARPTPSCTRACRSSIRVPRPTSRWPTRRATSGSRTTARSTTGPSDALSWRRRLSLSHALRHRVHPARVRALGHRLRLSAARHVRLAHRRSAATRVYVIRDRLGLKPVVYAHRGDGFAFASTVRALLPWLPRDARGLSAEGIDAYLAHRTIPAPRTVFTNMARLPPAH